MTAHVVSVLASFFWIVFFLKRCLTFLDENSFHCPEYPCEHIESFSTILISRYPPLDRFLHLKRSTKKAQVANRTLQSLNLLKVRSGHKLRCADIEPYSTTNECRPTEIAAEIATTRKGSKMHGADHLSYSVLSSVLLLPVLSSCGSPLFPSPSTLILLLLLVVSTCLPSLSMTSV